MPQPTPSIGRVVLYIVPAGPTMGEARPATVMGVRDFDRCDLHVQLTPMDEPALPSHKPGNLIVYVKSVPADQTGKGPGTWHWPPRV